MQQDRRCEIHGCIRQYHCKGLCGTHYKQEYNGKCRETMVVGQLRYQQRSSQFNENNCEIDGCVRPYKARGLCGTHYAQETRRGINRGEMIAAGRIPRAIKICEVTDCERKQEGFGLCAGHRQQERFGRCIRAEMRAFEARPDKCSVAGCNRKYYGIGFCQRHYTCKRSRGMSIADMVRLEQTELCEVCRQAPANVADHCHTTGRFRGALCQLCNAAEGMLHGDPLIARALAEYMERNMAVGNGQIVEASQPGHPVAVRALYTGNFAGARRLVG